MYYPLCYEVSLAPGDWVQNVRLALLSCHPIHCFFRESDYLEPAAPKWTSPGNG